MDDQVDYGVMLSKYAVDAMRTRGSKNLYEHFCVAAYGLAGEGGELFDRLKKHRFHAPVPDLKELAVKELGDVLWYTALLWSALEEAKGKLGFEIDAASKLNFHAGFSTRDTLCVTPISKINDFPQENRDKFVLSLEIRLLAAVQAMSLTVAQLMATSRFMEKEPIEWLTGASLRRGEYYADIAHFLVCADCWVRVAFNVTLEEVMARNIQKLKARYPEGFSAEKSVTKNEAAE
jgi:NTP pyrophosphatase (non-canonical NTP hydrolase)